MLVAIVAALLTGCVQQPSAGEGDGEITQARVLQDGTPQAIGVLALLNDNGTTLTVLDVAVGLDKRAATTLIAHRDGKDGVHGTSDDDKFDTIDEVDAVKYVGDSALAALLQYATDNDWIPATDDFYGSIETVEFTQSGAAGVVALCNSASVATLDVDVALDSRAAVNIVAKRPFTTVEQIAAVPYVGATALTHLRDYAKAHPITVFTTSAAVAALNAAVPGLLYTSESDYPLDVTVIPGGGSAPITMDNIKALLAPVYVNRPDEPTLAERDGETRTIADTFDRYTVAQDWWEQNNVEDQPKWQAVRDVFDHGLTSSIVYRFGTLQSGYVQGAVDVFIIGVSADGDLVLIHTISVET